MSTSKYPMERDPAYIIQVQPDWELAIANNLNKIATSSAQPNTTTTNTIMSDDQDDEDTIDVMKLYGSNQKALDIILPKTRNKFWLNLVRVDDNNEHNTIYQDINVDYSVLKQNNTQNNNTKNIQQQGLPKLCSEAVDITQFIRIKSNTPQSILQAQLQTGTINNTTTTSKNSTNKQQQQQNTFHDLFSFNIEKSIPTRGKIINTQITSPYYHNPTLHKNIYDSQRYKKQQQEKSTENSHLGRLRPEDLESDEDDDMRLGAAFDTMLDGAELSSEKILEIIAKDEAEKGREMDEYLKKKLINKLLKTNANKMDDTLQQYQHVVRGKTTQHVPIVNCISVNPVEKNTILSGSERGDLRVWSHNLNLNTTLNALLIKKPTTTTNIDGTTPNELPIIKSIVPTTQMMTATNQQDQQQQINNTLNLFEDNLTDPATLNVLYGDHIKAGTAHKGDITSTLWLPNGKLCLTTSLDTTTKLWAPEYNACMKTFVGHTRSVVKVIQHPHIPSQFVTASLDGSIIIYDTLNAKTAPNNILTQVQIIPQELTEVDNIKNIQFIELNQKVYLSIATNTRLIIFNPTPSATHNLTPRILQGQQYVAFDLYAYIRKNLGGLGMNDEDSGDKDILQDNISTFVYEPTTQLCYIASNYGYLYILSFKDVVFPLDQSPSLSKESTITAVPEGNENEGNNNNNVNVENNTQLTTTTKWSDFVLMDNTHVFSAIRLCDDAITSFQYNQLDGLLYLTTFQGDCLGIEISVSKSPTTQNNKINIAIRHVFSGTEQPLRCIAVDNIKLPLPLGLPNNIIQQGDYYYTRIIAGGDEGLFAWILPSLKFVPKTQ